MGSGLIDCGDGVTLERGVGFRLSDGTTLLSDHYYAAGTSSGAGPKPTLLMRQPYGRDIASTVVYAHPVWFARRGYNVVIQDVRGRGGSEGVFYPFRHEGRDGAETIAWLRTRPECNGRIGMYGFSYQGATQLLAAAERPAGLQCIAPAMTACDLYAGWFYHHGALRLGSSLGWGLQMLKEDAQRLGLREASDQLEAAWANLPAQVKMVPYAEHPAIVDEGLPSYVRDWFAHDAPGEYWSAMDVSARAAEIAVPALHVSGWYDTYLEGSVAGFELLRESSSAKDGQYLLAGPWVHIPWGDRVGDTPLGAEALLDTDTLLLRWFDHWLKDAGTWDGEPRVRHFALGSNTWRASDTVEAAGATTLYLHSGGHAESRKGDGTLTAVPPIAEQAEPADWFSYDPEVPVASPTPGSDQSQMELGNNLLVYTSVPLEAPLHVFGRPRVILHAATSAASADLTAKLVRLTPAGRAEFVCIGVARSTHLFADHYAQDTSHAWAFALEPTSCVFAAGDRIRLEVAGCAFPLYDRNPGVPGVVPRQASRWNWTRSTHTLFHDQEHPSALHLPTLASEEATPEGATT
jgi:putative CocE/NonD family hydrolase